MPSRKPHSRYAQWMYDWELRLTSVDNNRVVRPLEWGTEWTAGWPGQNGAAADPEQLFEAWNRQILSASDSWFAYATPRDFRLERREVQLARDAEVAGQSTHSRRWIVELGAKQVPALVLAARDEDLPVGHARHRVE